MSIFTKKPDFSSLKSYPLFLTLIFSLTFSLFYLSISQAAPPAPQKLVPANPTPNPLPNTHTAPTDTAVSVTYNENINNNTVDETSFAVQGMQTGVRLGSFSVTGGQITLAPETPFQPGELIQVSATTRTLNLSGDGPISPTVWSFRIAVPAGSGLFEDSTQAVGNSGGSDAALGDIDNDGDLDAFIGVNSGQDQLWLNDGQGNFSNSNQTLGTSATIGVALGDLDNDGDLDVFVANENQPRTVWFNNNGTLSNSGQTLASGFSSKVSLGDMDGDGDLDAVVAGLIHNNQIFINDGTGNFGSPTTFASNTTFAIALGDVDGDGDLDGFAANRGSGNKVWLNNGLGTLSDSGQSLGTFNSRDVALGDFDADGDLDAFVANENQPAKVWQNNGSGIFSDSGQSLGNTANNSQYVSLGDLDSDGDLDAVVANDGGDDVVWLNNGSGQFSSGFTTESNAKTQAINVGDVDGDGDLDLLASSFNSINKVWLNRNQTDLSLTKSADPASVGPTEIVTYTLFYQNEGPQLANNVIITDILPANVIPLGYSSDRPVTPTGSLSYTWQVGNLNVNENGTIIVTAQVKAQQAAGLIFTNTATITSATIELAPANNQTEAAVTVANVAPIAQPAAFEIAETVILNETVTATDPNLDSLTYSITSPPAAGNATITGEVAGTFSYTPANRIATYTTSFNFAATDPGDLSDTAIVIITVTATNDPLTGSTAVTTTTEDNSVSGQTPFTDPDEDDNWTYALNQAANFGDVSLNATGDWTYIPSNRTTDYTDMFSMVITDSAANSDTALVTIMVVADNDPLTATHQITQTDEEIPITGTLTFSDPDVNDTFTFAIDDTLAWGNLSIANDGLWLYTPQNRLVDYTDHFTLTISDSAANQVTTTLTISVTADNDPIDAIDDEVIVNLGPVALGVLANDLNDVGDVFTITAVGTPNQGGTVEINNPADDLIYTPPDGYLGREVFTYTVADSLTTDTATVTVVITGLPSLTFSKAVVPVNGTAGYIPGSPVMYTLAMTNSGEGPAVDLLITDTLPSGLLFGGFVNADGLTPTEANNTITWGPQNIPTSATYTLIFTATLDLQGTFVTGQPMTNTATYTAKNADPGSASTTFNVVVPVEGYVLYLPVIMKSN